MVRRPFISIEIQAEPSHSHPLGRREAAKLRQFSQAPSHPVGPKILQRSNFSFKSQLFESENFGKDVLDPLKLLNKICSLQLNEIFPELVIALKIF
jgi:hypothetical protein